MAHLLPYRVIVGSGCGTSSHVVWTKLAKVYASSSRARVQQLKYDLHTVKRGSQTMSEYILKVKSIADNLAAVACPVNDTDLVSTFLAGLSTDYDAFVTSINTHVDPIGLDELLGLMISQEIHQEKLHTAADISPSANFVTKNDGGSSNNNVNNHSSYQNRRNNNYRGRGRGARGRNNCSPQFLNRLICQACSRPGHSCFQCSNYQFSSHSSGGSTYPSSMITVLSSSFDPAWYSDTGATHHLTSDFANLTTSFDYQGLDKLHVGNITGLDIKSVGDSFLKTFDQSFRLSNMLHVPSVTKKIC